MHASARLLLFSLIVFSPVIGAAQVPDNKKFFAQNKDKVVFVQAFPDRNALPTEAMASGTGVLLKGGYVLTARHFEKAGPITGPKALVFKGRIGGTETSSYTLYYVGQVPDHDLLLFQFDAQIAVEKFACRRSPNQPVTIGDSLFILGFPQAAYDLYGGQRSEHVIAIQPGNVDSVGLGRIFTGVNVTYGHSGAPVFDGQGRVIGIVRGELTTADGQPKDVGVIVPIERAEPILPHVATGATAAECDSRGDDSCAGATSVDAVLSCAATKNLTRLSAHFEIEPTRQSSSSSTRKSLDVDLEISVDSSSRRGENGPASVRHTAARMASDLMLQLPNPSKLANQLDANLFLTPSGSLEIESDRGEARLELTRFVGFQTLRALDSAVAARSVNSVQQRVIDRNFIFAQNGSSEVVIDKRMQALRAGVYRLVMTAPGYQEISIFSELRDDGRLYVERDGSLRRIMATERIVFSRGPAPIIGLQSFEILSPTAPAMRFGSLARSLEGALIDELRSRGLEVHLFREGERAGSDPGQGKGEVLVPGVVPADLLVRSSMQLSEPLNGR